MIRLKKIALLALICALSTACDAASTGGSQTGPTAPPSTADAEAVATNFLNGWVNKDFDGMYGLLSAHALVMDKTSFTHTYSDVEQLLKLSEKGKSFEIHHEQTERQGNTVVIHYDMTFKSGPLGDFTDSNRVMRLILSQGKWRVAWSTMDIFEGMAGGAKPSIAMTQSQRGTIFGRNGRVIAQSNTPNYVVKLVTTKYPTGKQSDCFKKLADVFRLTTAQIVSQAGNFTGLDYGFIMGTLSQDDYKRLSGDLNAVCTLEYLPQTTRYYYSGSFAAQTVGFIGAIPADQLGAHPGLASDALIGRQGVEAAYQDELAGESGAQLIIATPDGTPVRSFNGHPPKPSKDVTLTLDRDLQVATERAIAGAYDYANWAQYSTGAAAVVLDVNTGEVLAMASYPTIDPDAFLPTTRRSFQEIIALYNKQRALFNRAVQETYAAGSVFKIVSTAAATESNTFKMTDVYVCKGVWDGTAKGDFLRKDWIYLDPYAEKPYHDAITLQQGLTASCDAYFWEVGSKLNGVDPTLLKKYANQMGLGVPTKIDVLGGVNGVEQSGNIPDPDWKFKTKGAAWGLGDNLNTVIGQGDVLVTPVQVSRMMMGIANGGTLYHPHLVKTVGQDVQPVDPPDQMNLQPQNLKGIQDGLCGVTSDAKIGTAHFVFYNWDFSRVSVCGKTGTAQTGSAYPNGWFAAYAGRSGQKPDIAIAVIVEHSREGSETAGPIVRRIIESYYKLPQEPWPDYWTGPYNPMADPNASDGGGPRKNTKKP